MLRWFRNAQELNESEEVVATFVVDEIGILRIADRRSEHYACAGGRNVQSAGEITFSIANDNISVIWVTNHSTGYCPEPESWPAVEAALERAGIPAPSGFSQAIVFRRCQNCQSINIVKDLAFVCDVCSAMLPREWNVDDAMTMRSS